MIKSLEDFPVDDVMTKLDLEDEIGCELSIKVCNDIFGVHGFKRERGTLIWVKTGRREVPYRRPEPVDVEKLYKVIEHYPAIGIKEIVFRLGMHPLRETVNEAMAKAGWEWVPSDSRWLNPEYLKTRK